MISVASLAVLYILTVILGRIVRRTTTMSYAVTAFFALLQAGLVLMAMYSMEAPKMLEKVH